MSKLSLPRASARDTGGASFAVSVAAQLPIEIRNKRSLVETFLFLFAGSADTCLQV